MVDIIVNFIVRTAGECGKKPSLIVLPADAYRAVLKELYTSKYFSTVLREAEAEEVRILGVLVKPSDS